MSPELKLVLATGLILVLMNLSLLIYLLKSTRHEKINDNHYDEPDPLPLRKSRDFRGIPPVFLGKEKPGSWVEMYHSGPRCVGDLRIIRTHFGDIEREPKD